MSALTHSTSEGDVEAITRLADSDTVPPQDSSQSQQQQPPSQELSTTSVQSAQPKKFTSLNVNKRFLEKASPIVSPALPVALKVGESNTPRLSSSPSNSTRLTSAKLSSVPKAQPTGWATTKPSTPGGVSSTASPAIGLTVTASATDPLPSDSSAVKPGSSPKPANQSIATAAGNAASPRLVSMGRQSPRPTSAGIDFGPISGRASPGSKGSLGTMNRAASPASASRAPWASLKSGLSSSETRPSSMSDFPTAAEAAKAKQAQEEKAAAAAAKEAARQQAALQALDRFRGTALGSGKHWDEMEDEDGGFLDEVVEFGDGTQYKIQASSDESKTVNPDAPLVSKEERFKDVSHDRSWPPRGPQPTPAATSKAPSAAMRTSTPTDSAAGYSRRSEQKVDKVIIPTTGASVSLRSPVESREPVGYGLGRERRAPRSDAPSAPVASQHITQAVRAWGPLAQRQASLNPGSAPPPSAVPKAVPVTSSPTVAAPLASTTSSITSPAAAPAAIAAGVVQPRAQSTTSSPSAVNAASTKPVSPALASAAASERSGPPPLAQSVRTSSASAGTPWGPKGLAQARLVPEAISASASAPAPSPAAPAAVAEEEDIQSAIERARKRRQEEENVRLAEKERARQKALAIEEQIKAAEAARQEEARKAAAAKSEAEAAQKKAAELASASQTPPVPQLARKSGPADNATSWRTTRSPSATASIAPKERVEQRGGRQEQLLADAAPSSQQQRAGRGLDKEQSSSKNASLPVEEMRTKEQPTTFAPSTNDPIAQTESVPAPSTDAELPRTILSRPPQPKQPSPVASTADKTAARRPLSSTQEKAARGSPVAPSRSKTRDNLSEQTAKDTTTVPLPTPVPVSVPVKLYPFVPQENFYTRLEIPSEAAPVWNRFVVRLAAAKPSPRLNRFQQKQLAAKAGAMSAYGEAGQAVSASTWAQMADELVQKPLTMDDMLFARPHDKSSVAVSMPTRVLPRGLPCIVIPSTERVRSRLDSTHARIGADAMLNANNDAALPESQVLTTKIQVKLPGRSAAVVQPALSTFGRPSHPSDGQVPVSLGDTSTDAIISEVLSMSSPAKAVHDDRIRSRETSAMSRGPLDHLHNGYASDSYGYAGPGAQQQSAGTYRKDRRGSNSGMGFYEQGTSNAPPVSFMVNSELRNDASAARGNLSPFGITSSARGSQTQTPASASSVLPSPSLSTQGTWGQSSLTFPVMEPRSTNSADRDHIKSVWSLAADSHALETQNSLKDIADDFLPSTMPMSLHDFRAEDPLLTGREVSSNSTVNLRQSSPSQFSRFSQYRASSAAPELSPVAHRSSGFEPSARSSSASREANAHLQAAAVASQQQRGSKFGAGVNGVALGDSNSQRYGSSFASTYRGQQNAGGASVGHNGLTSYGGYGSSGLDPGAADPLYNDVSMYGAGSMTPTNRQSYGKFMSQAPSARSAPGSPYSGDTARQNADHSAAGKYSLFSGSTGDAAGSNGGSSTQSPHGEHSTGLGVMDDSAASAAFGTSGRNQFYSSPASRGYHPRANWTSETTPNPPASTLRPAASVFNPQHYSPGSRSAAAKAHPSARNNGAANSSNSSGGPIDRAPAAAAVADTTNANTAAAFSSPSAAGYRRFPPSSGLW